MKETILRGVGVFALALLGGLIGAGLFSVTLTGGPPSAPSGSITVTTNCESVVQAPE